MSNPKWKKYAQFGCLITTKDKILQVQRLILPESKADPDNQEFFSAYCKEDMFRFGMKQASTQVIDKINGSKAI
jgi:hypothetical protein